MPSLPPLRLLLCLGLGLALSGAPGARAADNKPRSDEAEKVKFDTTDGVELRGAFYASTLGKKAPTVLLLHKIGGSSTQEGWDKLAHDLQGAGYAVLSFDFRGHGDSTSVAPNFWGDTSTPALASLTAFNERMHVGKINRMQPPATISIKDFNKGYYPALVNDIAAAKQYLDRRNNSSDCNSSNLTLIGAEDGATLGALWLYSDLNLYRVSTVNPLTGLPLRLESTPEGKDVTSCVWLTISPSLGSRMVSGSVLNWMLYAGREQKVPMAFLYGEKDTSAAAFSKRCYEAAKPAKDSKDAKSKLTGELPIKNSKLAGAALLDDKLEARSWIIGTYLKAVRGEQVAPAWEEKDTEKSAFAWVVPGTRVPLPAKAMGEKQLAPIPIDRFLR